MAIAALSLKERVPGLSIGPRSGVGSGLGGVLGDDVPYIDWPHHGVAAANVAGAVRAHRRLTNAGR